MIHRVRSLVAVLALGLPSVAAADRAPSPLSAFLQQDKYSYCDVKILSSLWKTSIADSKATVGAKVQSQNDAYLSAELVKARQAAQENPAARCKFGEAGFTYDDAVKLSKVWKNTAAEAKALAEDKILGGAEKYIRDLVKKGGDSRGAADDPASVFLKQSRFTLCDVKLLSRLWKNSKAEAKALIGAKVQSKNEAFLTSEIANARKQGVMVSCGYYDIGLAYEDVEKVAKAWKISVSEAKARIEVKASAGGASYVRQLAGKPATAADRELNAFLKQSKYTYCDAKMISGMWKQSVVEGKTLIGAKLISKNTRALTKAVTSARANAKKNPEARCSFDEAGFGYDDVMKLAGVWKKEVSETKARIDEMILNGQEAQVRATLKKAKPVEPSKTPTPPPPPPGSLGAPNKAEPGPTKAAPTPTKAPTKAAPAPTKAAPPTP